MHLNRVSSENLEVRLDAQFYRRDYLAAEQAVREAGALGATVGQLGAALTFFETGVSTKEPGALPLLKTRSIAHGCIRPFDFDETVEAPRELHLVPDDVLLCTYGTGSIGKTALVGRDGTERTVDYTIAILRTDETTIHPGYVAAFLGSRYGQSQIARHTKGTTGITFVLRSDLSRAVFPRFGTPAQRYIGDKVRQAERLRERARRLSEQLIAPFDAMVSERVRSLGSSRSWRIAGRGLEHRLDPGANHVRLVALREELRAAGPTRTLGTLVATPIPAGISLAEFIPTGPLYVRISDFDRGYWDSSAASVSSADHVSNAKGHFRPGDVVFARIGTVGKVGFADRHVPASSLSNNCSLLRPIQEEHGPWIFWCLRSALGDVQTGCLKSQTAQPKISNEDIEAIVLPDPDFRPSDFNERTEQHFFAARCADGLTSAAKLLVEHLIDGRLNEADLVAAQKGLEAGDRSADREILKGLHQSDAPDAKPLIADVDALYALLNGSEGQDA